MIVGHRDRRGSCFVMIQAEFKFAKNGFSIAIIEGQVSCNGAEAGGVVASIVGRGICVACNVAKSCSSAVKSERGIVKVGSGVECRVVINEFVEGVASGGVGFGAYGAEETRVARVPPRDGGGSSGSVSRHCRVCRERRLEGRC